jgi:hypothetical protein
MHARVEERTVACDVLVERHVGSRDAYGVETEAAGALADEGVDVLRGGHGAGA